MQRSIMDLVGRPMAPGAQGEALAVPSPACHHSGHAQALESPSAVNHPAQPVQALPRWGTPAPLSSRPGLAVVAAVLALHAWGLWALAPTLSRPETQPTVPVMVLTGAAEAPPPFAAASPVAPTRLPEQRNLPPAPSTRSTPEPLAVAPPVAAPQPVLPDTPLREAPETSAQVAGTSDKRPAGTSAPSTTPVAAEAGPGTPSPGATGAAAPGSEQAALRTDPGAQRVEPPRQSGAYLSNPPPPYPPISRRLGEQGQVTLRAFIEANGTASRVEVLSSSGFDRLDRAAMAAAKDWRYQPGTRAGQPAGMWFNLPVVFELK